MRVRKGLCHWAGSLSLTLLTLKDHVYRLGPASTNGPSLFVSYIC